MINYTKEQIDNAKSMRLMDLHVRNRLISESDNVIDIRGLINDRIDQELFDILNDGI